MKAGIYWSFWGCPLARTEVKVAKKSKIVKSERPAKYRVQQHNRCRLCGRPRAYMRIFGLCRICFRKLALAGQIPGVKKASW